MEASEFSFALLSPLPSPETQLTSNILLTLYYSFYFINFGESSVHLHRMLQKE